MKAGAGTRSAEPIGAAASAAEPGRFDHRELKRLIGVERPRIIELIAEARGNDGLSENAECHAAKEAHGLNEERIAELEDKLSRAEVIDVSKLIGSKTIKRWR
jgi:transcription elongation GreA/GreB family factor